MNALRGLITLLIALIMVKLFIDLIMFIFVSWKLVPKPIPKVSWTLSERVSAHFESRQPILDHSLYFYNMLAEKPAYKI